jgi:hypothetical protein
MPEATTETTGNERRVSVPGAAGNGIAARYRAQAAAERDLATFLDGVLSALGLDRSELIGFDDETNELLLTGRPALVPESDDDDETEPLDDAT